MLAWRQLSIFWRIPVLHCLARNSLDRPRDTVCSIAIRSGECGDDFAQECQRIDSSIVIFLDRASLSSATNGPAIKFVDYHLRENQFQHVYQLEQTHPLLEGLPRTVSIYGPGPIVTPLQVEIGMEVLVSLHGIPIVALHRHRLLIGADPWQFGHPSVPMLYNVLANWLVRDGRIKLRKFVPVAAIRLDDLPATAENLRANPVTKKLDRSRCKILKKLRRFARRRNIKFTLMYSSHFTKNKSFVPISTVTPRSIRQIQLGIKQRVFELGSHGMVHLRDCSDLSTGDPREFSDLDAEATVKHLETSENEIVRLFGDRPRSFVAPAWGYRPQVTKEIAGERYPIIIDSSQHVESGVAAVFAEGRKGHTYFNMVETFRSGGRMLTYSNADFWKCYSAAGIPVHYMQHTDTNWHILRTFLESKTDLRSERSQRNVRSRLLHVAQNPSRPRSLRVFSAAVMSVFCWLEPSSWRPLWMMLTSSSLYAIVRAMKLGGYRCVTVSELMTFIDRTDTAENYFH